MTMKEYRYTEYFENEVLFRFWGEIEELEGRVLRVVTLSVILDIDKNAWPLSHAIPINSSKSCTLKPASIAR